MSDACGCSDDKPETAAEEAEEAVGFWQINEIRAPAIAGVLLLTAWILSLTGGPEWLRLVLEIGALLVAAWTFVPSTLRRLAKGKIGVGTLMTIAAAGAVALGEYEEAAMLAFLYSISEGLEEYSLAKTRRGLRALLDLVPAEATVLRGGAEVTVDPAELVPGDRMVVRPGERLATDGRIITGRTSLDTSALTGESVPVEAGPGSDVYAGSINGTGPLEVEVTSTAENNSLARSEHPLARAILAASPARADVTDVDTVPGAGLQGTFEGKTVRLGRPGWINPGTLAGHVERMQTSGATAVLIESAGEVIGAVAVRDELRPEARDIIARLTASGYTTAMLTGDNAITAAALGKAAGISEVHADLRPEDKAEIIRTLKSRQPTAMVGDGVNDAPALATADTGVAMGAMGTDVAIETADIALMGEDLNHLPQVLDHARRTRSIMLQNVGLSLLLIAILIPLALVGALGLAAVVLIHELAEIVVIANGVRAGRISRKNALPSAKPAPALEPAS